MGLDLRLLPVFHGAKFSHTLISCDRDSDLFELITEQEDRTGIDVTVLGIYSFCGEGKDGEDTYGKTILTPYGKRMKSLSANELAQVFSKHSHDYWTNKAIEEYLRHLHHDVRIYLYWH